MKEKGILQVIWRNEHCAHDLGCSGYGENGGETSKGISRKEGLLSKLSGLDDLSGDGNTLDVLNS